MKKLQRLILTSAIVALSGNAAFANGGETASSYRVGDVQPALSSAFSDEALQLQKSAPQLQKQAAIKAAAAKLIDIGDWNDSENADIFKSLESNKATPSRVIGVGRDVWETKDIDQTAQALTWVLHEDGSKSGIVSFRSGNAFALRLGMLVQSIPNQAIVQVFGPNTAGPVATLTGAAINEAIKANIAADGNNTASNTYWLPVVADEVVTLEVILPADIANANMHVAIPRIAHIYDWPFNFDPVSAPNGTSEGFEGFGANGSDYCNYSSTCVNQINSIRNSVARLVLTTPDGTPSLCTGTLLADKQHSGTPFFLTAAHCVDSQTVASSVETDWLFQAATCGNPNVLREDSFRLVGGSQLLYSEVRFDTTLLQLNRTPTHPGVVYAGWWASQELSQSVYGISHPSGDLQKVSYGRITNYSVCTPFDSEGYTNCRPGTVDYSDYFNVNYSYGTTEGGSSGSALFARHLDGNYYVTGVLSSGNASCSARDGANTYGRFDRAYEDGMKYFLGDRISNYADLRPVYRFYNTTAKTHFYTQGPAERDFLIQTTPSMMYEGPQFLAYGYEAPGTKPVYRFYNAETGAHFYTISEAEKNHIRATAPASMQFEGTGWFAREVPGDGAFPLFRYYNVETSSHFYTINYREKLVVDAIHPNMHWEGVGYYAWPITSQ